MSSKMIFHIGPAARNCLKKTSPYATLLLEISNQLSDEDVSQFKLLLQADQHCTKRQVGLMKNGAEVLRFLDHQGYISKHCAHYLKHLLWKIGRKDLVKVMEKFGEKMKSAHSNVESSQKKVVAQAVTFTKLKDPGSCQQTAVKEVYWDYQRSSPDGASGSLGTELLEQPASSFSSSPMVVDTSASTSSQDSLKSSISDEEKIEYLSGKVWKLNTDDSSSDVVMSSQ